VQETFMTVERRILLLNDPAAYPKWVYRILHRRCIDLIRKQKPGMQESLPETVEWEAEAGLSHDLDETLENDMHKALHKLKPESYLVLHLYYLHDLDLTDIAEVTGVPVGTVKSRLFTARNSLKQHLGGYDEQD